MPLAAIPPHKSLRAPALHETCTLTSSPGALPDNLKRRATEVLRRRAPVERRLAMSFGLGVAVLLCMALFSAVQAERFLSSDRWVAHANQVIRDVEHTVFEVQAAESSQRGYTASGQETYLPPFQAAVALLPAQMAALRREISDDPAQLRRYVLFTSRIGAKLATMQQRFEERRTLGLDALAPKYLNGRGRQAMEAVIAVGSEMIEAENTLLRQHADARAIGLHTTVGLLLGISALGAGLLGAGFLFARRELRRSHTLGGELARANLGLESEIADRRRAQQRLGVQHAVAHIAAKNVTLAQAAPLFLQSIGEYLDWQVGELWTVDPATNRLRLTNHWHPVAGTLEERARNTRFEEASRE